MWYPIGSGIMDLSQNGNNKKSKVCYTKEILWKMINYCAFLRGVNVNGRKLKMADACHFLESAGLSNLKSVLATGNFIFDSEM